MDRQTWTIAAVIGGVVLAIVLGLTFAGKNRELKQRQTAIEESRKELDDAQLNNTKLEDELAELRQQLEFAQAQMHELEEANALASASRRSLEDEMRAELESKDITISRLQGRLTLNILDQVLFDSGEAVLKPDGAAVLNRVAKFLTEHPAIRVHVIGHTDNVPIRPDARDRFASNWELSLARSAAAVRYLSERAGVDPGRLGAVGYGEYRPVADNASAAGRARNRRIEIMILPDEAADHATNATVKTTATTIEQPRD